MIAAYFTGEIRFSGSTLASTYCFVASSRADVGSVVTVTDVKPPRLVAVAPRLMVLVPIVIEPCVQLVTPAPSVVIK